MSGILARLRHAFQDELLVRVGRNLELKRVFAIEIGRCRRCGGRLEVIASIEEPALIERILAHCRQRAEDDVSQLPLGARPRATLGFDTPANTFQACVASTG